MQIVPSPTMCGSLLQLALGVLRDGRIDDGCIEWWMNGWTDEQTIYRWMAACVQVRMPEVIDGSVGACMHI